MKCVHISLAAGCTCVIKVPEETPFSGLALMEVKEHLLLLPAKDSG
jgi:acyl-CoA reductase-like NAD-dependent aldehyde dehydrogenase